ncbi:uncharacterized protein LOC119739588 [Patiria miniata]|uniref:Uncharacterized protein n=1 Tax=Patiria miniata TaxID=46514 RepID=A0A914B2D4_PATMI|nr:uncharacterized protein LOC119739588 [Patiria miniata]
MSLKQNIATAVRQSSLAKSNRMGELLQRFESGVPCGTPDDIDFLIDEIVKRIERRLLCRLARLSELAPDQASEGDEHTRAAKFPIRPRRTISETTLRHEARLIVDQVLKIVIRHLKLVGQKKAKTGERTSKQPGREVVTSTEHRASTSRDGDTKISPQIVKRYNYVKSSKQAEPRRLKEIQPTAEGVENTKEAQAYQRLPPRDGDSVRTATTYALRKADKTSLRRFSVTGNVNALMLAGEWAKDDDNMEIITESKPASKTVTAPIHQDVKILLASSGDSSDDRVHRKVPCDDAPEEYRYAPFTPRKEPPKTRGINQFLNSSFTYARRAEIKKSLPKFLVSRSREAMMTMFNAIRVAMAEEEIENLDYAGVFATLMDRSLGKKDFPQQATTSDSRPKAIFRQQPGTERLSEKKTAAKPRYDHRPNGKNVPSSADGISRDRLNARQQNFGTLGTYTLRKATRSCLRHMIQKGSSYNALLMMACNLRNGQTDEEFWDEALDMDLDEATRKEVISDLAELSRQARDGTGFSDDPRQTFDDSLEKESVERKTVAFGKAPPRSETSADQRDNVYSRGGVRRQSNTNYIYGMHRGLRRLLPKFTGGRPYSALMHYADSMIADVYQEMIRTGQFMPLTTLASATEPRKINEKVTSVGASYTKPVHGDRWSVSTQTGKKVAKTSNEELFHDAYSWIAQESRDKYGTMSEKQRYKEQVLPTKSDEDILYRPVEDVDGGKEGFARIASQQGTTVPEKNEEPLDDGINENLWLSVEENDADETKRSVRFADGINPGETDNDNQDQSSTFFQKLGYYERVGSGELLHKKTKQPKQKAQSKDEEPSEISQAGLEQEEGDNDEIQQPERPQEKTEERPLPEEAPQQTDETTTKPSYSLCNCL